MQQQPLQNNINAPNAPRTKRPSDRAIYALKDTLKKRLFHQRQNGFTIKYETDDILNFSIVYPKMMRFPENYKSIGVQQYAQQCHSSDVHKIGVRGSLPSR